MNTSKDTASSPFIKLATAKARITNAQASQDAIEIALYTIMRTYLIDGQVDMLNHAAILLTVDGFKVATKRLINAMKFHTYDKNAKRYSGGMTKAGKKRRDEMLNTFKAMSEMEQFSFLIDLAWPAKKEKKAVEFSAQKFMKAKAKQIETATNDDNFSELPEAVRVAYKALQAALKANIVE